MHVEDRDDSIPWIPQSVSRNDDEKKRIYS